MTRADEAAFPGLKAANWSSDERETDSGTLVDEWAPAGGLSKREWFAGMALQGFLAGASSPQSQESIDLEAKQANQTIDEFMASLAVGQADALLAELEKERP